MYFSEYLLHYLIEGIQDIKDKYFILSPQHRKLSDASWDTTTDPEYLNIPYSECNNIDIFDLRYKNKHNGDISITLEERGKYAGWFDVYSKEFYENIAPIHDDWKGYGPWDWYSLILGNIIKQNGISIKHYTLRGQTIGEYWVGPLLENDGYSGYYKNQLVQIFESNMENYVKKGLQMLKEKNII